MNYEIDDNGVLTFRGRGDLFVCTADRNRVTRIVAPAATKVYCDGCTGLTSWFEPQVIELLESGGKSIEDIRSSGAWDCHEWSNCPMHVAFDADGINEVPERFRAKAAIFVGMFDAGLLSPPWAKCG